jgi:hypothetical protein
MNITTMGQWFDLLQDKYGSAYFTDAEKSLFLNRAQIEFVSDLLPTDPTKVINAELSQDTISQIAPLIVELSYLSPNSSGVITKANIQAALTSADSGAIMWRPLAIGWTYGGIEVPASYIRHNDRWEFQKNFFKRPTVNNPKVRETATSYIFSPATTNARIYFTLLKYPREVSISAPTDSILPDFTHNKIVAIALEFAGIGSRDSNMTELLKLQQQK